MKIIELCLDNFKGVRSLALNFGGADAKIWGDNATGKTSVMDAFIWLLTGKDHLGRSDLNFNIKTLDSTGSAIPMIDHSVRAVVEHDGATFELIRIFKEVWQKKTGTNVQTFTGHKTEYYVDSVPRSEKEYTAFINRIAPPQLLNLLIMPAYFNEQLKAEDRRKLLLEMCGDVSEDDMLSTSEWAILNKYTSRTMSVADLKKAKQTQKTKINDSIKSIPVAINVHTQYLKNVEGLNAGIEQASIDAEQARIRALEEKLSGLRNGETLSKLRKELAELETEKVNFNILNDQAMDRAIQDVRKEISVEQDQAIKLQSKQNAANKALEDIRAELAFLRCKKNNALTSYHAAVDKEFSADTVCPTCGQVIPAESLNAAKAQFNENKSKQLESIIESGKKLAADISEMEPRVAAAELDVKQMQDLINESKAAISHLQQKIAEMSSFPKPVFDSSRIDAKRAEIAALAQSTKAQEDDLASQIKRITDEKSAHERNLSALDNAKQASAEIKKLKENEKELAASFEECEYVISLCDDFTNARVKMLDDLISGSFKIARFKLTETLVNGGLHEICDTLIDGVPYSAANNAARINVGLDIIRTFSEHYGVFLPVFVDNAESVTALDSIDAQVIQLIVSEQHKTLTMEVN